MNILVNGIGNIGTTLLLLLSKFKKELSISKIYALKNRFFEWNESDINLLQSNGVEICSKDEKFTKIDNIINSIDYIFDTTSNSFGNNNKLYYNTLPNLKAASAQGSEKGFGTSYMSGINDEIVKTSKFVHIVSCNTHSLASILITICHQNLSDFENADFVIVRRSEDIGNHQRLVAANVVARHLDPKLGTHHSIDLQDLFLTINKKISVTSSDITTPSQMLHSVRFNINLKNNIDLDTIINRIENNHFVSQTKKFDTNVVFELGRRYGFSGRIYSHAIFVSNNFLISENNIKGWAFIPQEGNTLISTINAFLLQMQIKNHETIIKNISFELIKNIW